MIAESLPVLLASPLKVLDHGFVRLVDAMGSDLSIVRAARVSYDAAWRAGENEASDRRLLRYLLTNRHSTPFEAVTLTFEVKAPIFVFRQWHRHRTQSYNELSARYRALPAEFYLPEPEQVGVQATSNKQGRDVSGPTSDQLEDRRGQIALLKVACENAFAVYQSLLNAGWPRELARMALPLNTYSVMFTTLNLWNLLGFLNLRAHAHAQWETRQYAEALITLTRFVCPETVAIWESSRAAQ